MAIISPSALISKITGKSRGSCFQSWKNLNVMRSSGHPRRRIKASIARYRGLVCEVSGCYSALSEVIKQSWDDYSDLLPGNLSGFNAFIARNVALLYPDHPCLDYIANPPGSYDPPDIPAYTGLCFDPFSGFYCFSWQTPNSVNSFVQLYYAPQLKYNNSKHPKLRYHSTVHASDLHAVFDSLDFNFNTVLRFAARSINLFGEVSGFSTLYSDYDLGPLLSVISPNGGEEYLQGEIVNILWRCKNIDDLDLFYSLNSGVDWINISSGFPASAGEYSWTLPNVSSSNCLVKLVSPSAGEVTDISDSEFSIV